MNMDEDIKKKILNKGYWRVVIRPSISFYKKDRFDISKLSKPIEDAQVRLRGWYYPHIDNNGVEISAENKIKNFCDFEGHVEYWEFATSGQFGHIFSMHEDYIIDLQKTYKIRSNFIFDKNNATEINKFFEVVSTIYKFTEIYKFASNLAQLKEYEDVKEFEISIELHGLKDRMLFFWDQDRDLFSPYICKIDNDKISFSKLYKTEDLIAYFDSHALENSVKTFQFFGWQDPSEQVLKEDQRKLLERRF